MPVLLCALPPFAGASQDRRESGGADTIELASKPPIGGVRPVERRLLVAGTGIAVGDPGILALVIAQPPGADDQEGSGTADRGEGASIGDAAIVMGTAGAFVLDDAAGMGDPARVLAGDNLAQLLGDRRGSTRRSNGLAGRSGSIIAAMRARGWVSSRW